MSIEIQAIKNKGSEKDERIVFRVLKDCDLGYFIVLDTTYVGDNAVSNKLRHTYWFPDKEVKAGDLVVLYTKVGTNYSRINQSGSTTHFYYWDLELPILNDEKDIVGIIEAKGWEFKAVT